jgi:DNA-binding PadR family transcriptional regulator
VTRSELSLFSYEVMGLVGKDGAGPHDLLTMARRGRILDWAGESQYYVEPKRLAKLGYLEARPEPGRTRPRTVYSLTEKGREALREFATAPLAITPLKSEPLLRLLIADLVGEEATKAAFLTLREDLVDVRRRLEEGRRSAAALPHRAAYLELVNDFLERFADLHEQLADEVDRLT